MIRIASMFLLSLFLFSPVVESVALGPIACGPGDTVTVQCTGTPPPSTVTCPDGSTVPAGTACPVPPADACPAGTIRFSTSVTTPGTLFTKNAGGMTADTVVTVAFTTGNNSSADNNLPTLSGSEYDGPLVTREATISKEPCNFNLPYLAAGAAASGTTVMIPFALGTGANWDYYPKLELNKTYYFNIRNYSGSKSQCGSGCNMIISLQSQPPVSLGTSTQAMRSAEKKSKADLEKRIKEWKKTHHKK